MSCQENRIPKLKFITRLAARVGTGLCLMVLIWSCATVPGLKEETAGTFIRVPFVLVFLQENSDQAVFAADGAFAIECLTGGEQAVYYYTQPVEGKNRNWSITVKTRSCVSILARVH